jgi:hypothetical protein
MGLEILIKYQVFPGFKMYSTNLLEIFRQSKYVSNVRIEVEDDYLKINYFLNFFVSFLVKIFLKKILFHSPIKMNIYGREKSRILLSVNLIKKFISSNSLLFYGDSIYSFEDEQWYVSRPKHSPIFLKSHDYLGPLIFSKIPIQPSKIVEQFLEKGSCDLVCNFDFATSLIPRHEKIRKNKENRIEKKVNGNSDLKDEINTDLTKFSIIIPTDFKAKSGFGVSNAISSIIEFMPEIEVEIILVYSASRQKEFTDVVLNYSHLIEIKGVSYSFPFNYSATVNLGIENASNEYIFLMNDDVILFDYLDIQHVMSHFQSTSNIGAIGFKLLTIDKKIQHVGINYVAGEPQHFLRGSDNDYLKSSHFFCREVSGVTAALMLIKKSVLLEVGFLDEDFPLDYNDVELMLRLRNDSFEVLYCSSVSAFHYESLSRQVTDNKTLNHYLNIIIQKHGTLPNRDPYLYTPLN